MNTHHPSVSLLFWSQDSNAGLLDEFMGGLLDFMRMERWFGGKGRRVCGARILHVLKIEEEAGGKFILLVEINYGEGEVEIYQLPVLFLKGDASVRGKVIFSWAGGRICDASEDADFAEALLKCVANRDGCGVRAGRIGGFATEVLCEFRSVIGSLAPRAMSAEQSNSAVCFGERLLLKLFRRVARGRNPDLEIARHFSRHGFTHTPALVGGLEFDLESGGHFDLGILTRFYAHARNGWELALDGVKRFLSHESASGLRAGRELFSTTMEKVPESAESEISEWTNYASLLGRSTAEMHRFLAFDGGDQDFFLERETAVNSSRRLLKIREEMTGVFAELRDALPSLSGSVLEDARLLLERAEEVCAMDVEVDVGGRLQRVHGDYHLGQVLWEEGGFLIIDFEGEPTRPLEERREKKSPMKDLAGMLRSLDYAAHAAIISRDGMSPCLRDAAGFWADWCGGVFLRAYLSSFSSEIEFSMKELRLELMGKAAYEIRYELRNRPGWVGIPMRGMLGLLSDF